MIYELYAQWRTTNIDGPRTVSLVYRGSVRYKPEVGGVMLVDRLLPLTITNVAWDCLGNRCLIDAEHVGVEDFTEELAGRLTKAGIPHEVCNG